MFTFKCPAGHVTEIPDLRGADRDAQGRFFITCGYFETETPQQSSRHSLSQVRAKIHTESNAMNAMDADNLEEWSCEDQAYQVTA